MASRLTCATLAPVAALTAAIPLHADTIAVTEFMRNPYGADDELEWVELFNYGPSAVNLDGWTVTDDNPARAFTIPNVTVPSGGYLVLVPDKAIFEGQWGFGDDDRIIGGATYGLNNSSIDQIVLANDLDQVVWTLGTAASSTAYRATFLVDTGFAITNYGEDPNPLINSDGTDGTGTLGYEDNSNTLDPEVFFSSANGGSTEYGSPLAGHYSVVPEPASLALIGAAVTLLASRRRSTAG